MKNNQPVTNNEISFSNEEEIISTTDLKGQITSYNKTFLNISGFSPEELNGASHNIVRHPDMPPAAFSDLWSCMKADNHWMGMVKNRCKNGDYYWVDAYVTPIKENGQTTGYESVRAKPTPEQVQRADTIYKAINAGKKPTIGSFVQRLTLSNRLILANVFSVSVVGAAIFSTAAILQTLSYPLGIALGMLTAYVANKWALIPLADAVKEAKKDVDNPLMAMVYTGRTDEIGQIQLPGIMLQAKMRTVLGRINDAALTMSDISVESSGAVAGINKSIEIQAGETELVATAITEMTSSVQEVANTASHAASVAKNTDTLSEEGVAHASGAAEGLQVMTAAVNNIAEVVAQLADDTKNIDNILSVIQGVAEQTNLLALNAAIEAARAGEHGRGFAVVADEVRTLASRTQESTEEIHTVIDKLNVAVGTAVNVLADSQQSASDSEGLIMNAIDSLKGIASEIHNINDLNAQIASAVKEQSTVSEEVSENVNRISHSISDALDNSNSAEQMALDLSHKANEMQGMVVRFANNQ
jgi:aerotaxis receptor